MPPCAVFRLSSPEPESFCLFVPHSFLLWCSGLDDAINTQTPTSPVHGPVGSASPHPIYFSGLHSLTPSRRKRTHLLCASESWIFNHRKDQQHRRNHSDNRDCLFCPEDPPVSGVVRRSCSSWIIRMCNTSFVLWNHGWRRLGICLAGEIPGSSCAAVQHFEKSGRGSWLTVFGVAKYCCRGRLVITPGSVQWPPDLVRPPPLALEHPEIRLTKTLIRPRQIKLDHRLVHDSRRRPLLSFDTTTSQNICLKSARRR